jgi:hypothetical protein
MAELWDKYLVLRRDNTVPEWPYFVLGARDPAAVGALRHYALAAEFYGMAPEYHRAVHDLAAYFDAWRAVHGAGDPDGPRHRVDDPSVVSRIIPRSG